MPRTEYERGTNMNHEAVTVIGLGSMGAALAEAFRAAGHPTTVWNRSAAKSDDLVARGAVRADTVAEAIAASPVIVVCVLDYDSTHTILKADEAALAGRTLVNLSSGSPEQARETASWAAGLGVAYLDGAIMSTPPGIGSPEAMLLYSGDPAAFARHAATLRALGDPVDLGPDAGVASLYDTALLGVMWATLTGWLHGSAVVGADGVGAAEFTPIANRWLAHAVTGFIDLYAGQVDAGAYPGDDATLDVHLATMDHLVHAARARGVDTALPELYRTYTRRAIAAGHGSDGYARLVEELRK
ncbi:NAD(P)-binding domain-containing protein [Embleya sp. NBC_00888]|uniref:NAD(P)-dependent oxidoreductase n=1 Tax=Embleya sp. NBC_00888 TaxID=2975960 RepID=UPI0038633164|nr:NAD(P)-binding domain-containing protein [Embleya sp. NBC_00888]